MKMWNTKNIIILVLIGIYSMSNSVYAIDDVRDDAFTDISNKHWAYDSVNKAADKGYVSGYENGTFKPDRQVSRAEFITMVIRSDAGYIAEGSGDAWYSKYVQSAINYGLISKDEFKSGDYNTPMSRLEMAKVAVNASGLKAESDEEYVLVATKNGLLHGMGNGELNLTGTTTRAQSVAIIERILAIKAGEKLPVDALAIKAAEASMNKQKDAWGDVIRTTDLPKNASYYPYILEHIPNKVYEEIVHPDAFAVDPLDLTQSPSEIYDHPGYTKAEKDSLAQTITNYGDLIFNVDYRTIGDDWIEAVYAVPNMSAYVQEASIMAKFRTRLEEYVQYVKDNKIVMSGSLHPEMSTLSRTAVDYYIIVKADITVKESSLFDTKKVLTVYDFVYGATGTSNPPVATKGSRVEWYFLMMLAGNNGIAYHGPMPTPNFLYGFVLVAN